MCNKLKIYPEPDGTYCMDGPHDVMICKDADAVGEFLEPFIWPMVRDALRERKSITITVEYESEKL